MQRGPAQRGDSAYSGETDADLLVYMSLGKDDPAASRAAWEEFYSRHARYLYAVSLRAYGALLGGEAGVCDLVADTFRRAYEHAGTFDAGGVTDPERQRLRTRAWLGRIAQRLAQSTLRGQRRTPMRSLDPDEWQNVAQAQPRPAEDTAQADPVRDALMSLSERERLVLRVTLQWYRPGEEHQRLPNEVAADLARTLADDAGEPAPDSAESDKKSRRATDSSAAKRAARRCDVTDKFHPAQGRPKEPHAEKFAPDIYAAARCLGWILPTDEDAVREAEREAAVNPVELPATLQSAKEVFQRADSPAERRIVALGGPGDPQVEATLARAAREPGHLTPDTREAMRRDRKAAEEKQDRDRHGKDVR